MKSYKMPPLITYTFKHKFHSDVSITLQSYSEEEAWYNLYEYVFEVEKWELSK